MEIILPVNSEGEVNLPISGLKNPVVRESGVEIYKNGACIQGISEITPGKRDDKYISFNIGSGTYLFWVGESL